MRKLLWMVPCGLVLMAVAAVHAGETATPGAKGPLDERVDFASDTVGLAEMLKLLDSKKIGYVLPSVWEAREAQAAARMANANEQVQQRLKGAGKVTMKLANVPLRVAVQQFAAAFGVECDIVEGDGYQLVVFHDEDGARLEGAQRGGRGMNMMGMGMMRGGMGMPPPGMGPGGPGQDGQQGGQRGQRGQRGGNRPEAGGGAPAENF